MTLQATPSSKPLLTVLFAAGGSLSFGIPSTRQLTEAALTAIRSAESDQLLLPLAGSTRTDMLWSHLQNTFGSEPNFEHLLHALESIASLRRTWRATTQARFRIMPGILSGGPHGSLVPCFDDLYSEAGTRALYEALYRAIIANPDTVTTHSDWARWCAFLAALEDSFDVVYATTNYDQVLEATGSFSPEDQGFFSVNGLPARRFLPSLAPSPRLMHLHGSICFGYLGPDHLGTFRFEDDHEDLYLYDSHDEASATWSGRSNATSGAGDTINVGPMITGLHKPDKLLAQPFRGYSELFYRALLSRSRLLVIGYGFGDPHLNLVLRRMTKWHASSRRVAYVGHQAVWPVDHLSFSDNLRTIMCWAEEEAPLLSAQSRPSPYEPSGSGPPCFQGWFGGLNDVLQDRSARLLSFLAS